MLRVRKRLGAIGLDIGSRRVKALQIWQGGPRPRIAAAASFPRFNPDAPLTAAEISQISDILARQGLVGKDVVINAPADKLRSAILDLPAKSAGVPMDQIARAEFARVQKLEPTAAEISWWELPTPVRAGKGTVVMTVAYPHVDAEPYIELFQQAGLRVRAVDAPTSALARGAIPLVAGKRSFGVLDLGASASVLVLVLGGVVAYERRIAGSAISGVAETLRERLGVSAEIAEHAIREVGLTPAVGDQFGEARGLILGRLDSAIAELRRTLAYAVHQYADATCDTLLLSGGGAGIPGLCEHIAAQAEIEVRPASLKEGTDFEGLDPRRLGPGMVGALGLARFA